MKIFVANKFLNAKKKVKFFNINFVHKIYLKYAQPTGIISEQIL